MYQIERLTHEKLQPWLDEILKDPEACKKFLQDAGIIDKNGELTEPYRSTQSETIG